MRSARSSLDSLIDGATATMVARTARAATPTITRRAVSDSHGSRRSKRLSHCGQRPAKVALTAPQLRQVRSGATSAWS
jgi:hypothetical protein